MKLTAKKDLRSGTPVWMDYRRHIPRAKQLKGDLKTDVLIVGARISGALIAYALARGGHRVAVVDRRGPLMGSTPASTALLLFEIDTPLIHLKRKLGARPAERAWLRSKAALDSLYELTRRERIEASMSLHPSVYLAGDILDARGLAKEVRARERLGLPSRYLDRRKLRERFGLSRSAAIVSENSVATYWRSLALCGSSGAGPAGLASAHDLCPAGIGRLDQQERRLSAIMTASQVVRSVDPWSRRRSDHYDPHHGVSEALDTPGQRRHAKSAHGCHRRGRRMHQ